MKHTSIKIAGLFIALLFCLPAAPILANKTQPYHIIHRQTYNPLANETTITVTITQIRSVDFFLTKPSFQADIIINGEHHQTPIYNNTPYIYTPWNTTQTVNSDEPWVNITIALTDTKTNKLCDLSPCHEDTDKYNDTVANIYYNLNTGHWIGDDWAFYWDEGHDGDEYHPEQGWGGTDLSGYGHLNGCDDGSINRFDRDAELYFTITQPTPAPDGIPYWVKTQIYNLTPEIDYTGYDPNGDGIPLTWDFQWGYDPFSNVSIADLDPDNDGLTNIREYRVSQWGSDPYSKDIYIELDRMADSPRGEASDLPNSSKEAIVTAFAQHNFEIHLDDGSMGGQDIIPFKENTTDKELRTIYYKYFLHNNLSNWRAGIFHYGLVIYNASYGGFNFWNGYTYYFDCFQISCKRMEEKTIPKTQNRRTIVYGSGYMHELGHNIGLNEFPGIDNRNSAWPWNRDWWKYRPYVSIMNYGYMYSMIGFSDGHRGKNDYNDWMHIDLGQFNSGFD